MSILLLLLVLNICAMGAASESSVIARLEKRQTGPTDPGISKDCTYFDTALDSTFTCQYFAHNWGITETDFINWNPSVKPDCSGIIVGHSYCVEAKAAPPTTSSATTTTTAATTTTTAGPGPSPTQTGLAKDCTAFYKAKSGDYCARIAESYGNFTTEDFIQWNPGVGSNCSSLLVGFYYCVGVPGRPTTTSSVATMTATATTTLPPAGAPSPTQDGIVKSCNEYYQTVSGDTCQVIVDRYKTFTLDDFYNWNPAVGHDCLQLWLGYYYCVGVS